MTRYLILVLIFSSFNSIFAVEKRCDFRIFLNEKEQRNNKSDPFEVLSARYLITPLAINRLTFFENLEANELILRGFSNPAMDSENQTELVFKKIEEDKKSFIRVEGTQYGQETRVDISQERISDVDDTAEFVKKGEAYTKTITKIKGVISGKKINLNVEEVVENGEVIVKAKNLEGEDSLHSGSTFTFDIDQFKEEDFRKNLFNFNVYGGFLGSMYTMRVKSNENAQQLDVFGNVGGGTQSYEMVGNQILALNERLTKLSEFDERLYVFKYLVFLI